MITAPNPAFHEIRNRFAVPHECQDAAIRKRASERHDKVRRQGWTDLSRAD
jgi:hypothetical protein